MYDHSSLLNQLHRRLSHMCMVLHDIQLPRMMTCMNFYHQMASKCKWHQNVNVSVYVASHYLEVKHFMC